LHLQHYSFYIKCIEKVSSKLEQQLDRHAHVYIVWSSQEKVDLAAMDVGDSLTSDTQYIANAWITSSLPAIRW
jgi:hypothetical protein